MLKKVTLVYFIATNSVLRQFRCKTLVIDENPQPSTKQVKPIGNQ